MYSVLLKQCLATRARLGILKLAELIHLNNHNSDITTIFRLLIVEDNNRGPWPRRGMVRRREDYT